MSWRGQTSVRKKRAKRFLGHKGSQEIKSLETQLEVVKGQLATMTAIAQERELVPNEGREIISLSNRVRRLEKKLQKKGYGNILGDQNDPS